MYEAAHGGNVWGFERPMIDFSASLNPLGMPPEVLEAAKKGVEASIAYPDPACTALKRSIASALGIPEGWIFCGNGAAELIDRLIPSISPRKTMLLAPTFGEYERALQANCCKMIYHYIKSENEFDLRDGLLKALRPSLSLLILCNPNNPTGRVIAPDLMEAILRRCAELNTFLLVDESFLELTNRDKRCELTAFLGAYPNLILLRSMTKSYCMPGLRLGYLLTSNSTLLQHTKQTGQPWSVSVPAQYAGIAALSRPDWAELGMRCIMPQRQRLKTALEALGLRVWESHTNYLLFQAEGKTDLREALVDYGILIRSCANFRGLGADFYRIAVRKEEENTMLLNALECILTEGRENYGKTADDTGNDLKRR